MHKRAHTWFRVDFKLPFRGVVCQYEGKKGDQKQNSYQRNVKGSSTVSTVGYILKNQVHTGKWQTTKEACKLLENNLHGEEKLIYCTSQECSSRYLCTSFHINNKDFMTIISKTDQVAVCSKIQKEINSVLEQRASGRFFENVLGNMEVTGHTGW